MKEKEIYKKALKYWGNDLQLMMLFEEMGELQQAVSKYKRNIFDRKQVAEEIADVEIMLGQVKEMWDLETLTHDWKVKKLSKLNVWLLKRGENKR